jgi:hypothetical protein
VNVPGQTEQALPPLPQELVEFPSTHCPEELQQPLQLRGLHWSTTTHD